MTPQESLSREIIDAFDNVNGRHPGFRPAHAKGILLSGEFTPAPEAAGLTSAPHVQRPSTRVWVRFSDFAGVPNIPDNSQNAAPRGIAIRFHLADHVHTDITAHSADGFPARTAEEFLGFLRAVANPPSIPDYLAAHPAALAFVQIPKPAPVSFATESYFAVNALRFTSQAGVSRFGRYRIRPAGGPAYLEAETAAAASSEYLFEELRSRIEKGPVEMQIVVQLAADADLVDDATVQWPADRPEVAFGTLRLTAVVPQNAEEQRHIIFDPIPRVEGIDLSGDPLLQPRADVYLMSGRRRRADGAVQAASGS